MSFGLGQNNLVIAEGSPVWGSRITMSPLVLHLYSAFVATGDGIVSILHQNLNLEDELFFKHDGGGVELILECWD